MNLRGTAEADPRPSTSDILRPMNAAAWGVTFILGLAIGVGCRGAHGNQECVEGCEADAYCSVSGDRDPDGGCQFSATCEARPATCAAELTCDCLIEQELMSYREQGWSDDEVSVECEGDAASGFTVASSLSAKCLPNKFRVSGP